MNNRITHLFKKKKKNILSVYYTAGFPSLESTVPIAKYLENSGADMIEIGIPFSDPIADGPTIQDSNKIALDNGMNLHLLIDQVRSIRTASADIPVILMGYLNPVIQYGIAQFLKDASQAGVDGLILPDMPAYEYAADYKSLFEAENLCNTFLISPTTSDERIRQLDDATNGFVYAVSASSTTGAKGKFDQDQLRYFDRLQKMKLRNPCLIGFGISNHETFTTACQYAAGAIVGSAFINVLKKNGNGEDDIAGFVKSLKGNESADIKSS